MKKCRLSPKAKSRYIQLATVGSVIAYAGGLQQKIILKLRKYKRLFFFFILCLLFTACKPAIYEFKVTPLVIGPDDSIRMNWKIRGTPTISVHDQHPGADTTYRVVTLTANSHGKEVYREKCPAAAERWLG